MQVDLISQRSVSTTWMTIENDSKKKIEAVTLCLQAGWPEKVAHFQVEQLKKKGPNTNEILSVLSKKNNWYKPSEASTEVECVDFSLPSALARISLIHLKVTASFLHVLVPRPATVHDGDMQRYIYNDTAHIVSPYEIVSETVDFKTGVKPISFTGPSIAFNGDKKALSAKYSNVEPYSVDLITIHYVNEFPFAEASLVERMVRVSHWSGIHVDEQYDIHHGGAKMVGRFARDPTPSGKGGPIKSFTAVLPEDAQDLYFKDRIGRITTLTSARDFTNAKTLVNLNPRYPLFGGWATKFRFGYSLTLNHVVSEKSNRYIMQLSGSPSLTNVVSDEVLLRVLLPEGAHNVQVETSDGFEEVKQWKEKSYLVSSLVNFLKYIEYIVRIDCTFVCEKNCTNKLYEMIVLNAFVLFLWCTGRFGKAYHRDTGSQCRSRIEFQHQHFLPV